MVDFVTGDDVRVRLTKVKKKWAEGVIEQVLEPSEWRLAVPKCVVAGQCGSCQWQSVAYSMQLDAKKNQVIIFCRTCICANSAAANLDGM